MDNNKQWEGLENIKSERFKLGFYSGKLALVLAVYVLFSFAELNINILEWAVLSRLIFVTLGIGLFFNPKPNA